MIREYVYLGNIPIGLFTKEKPNELLQIHTDHLGTLRAVTSKDKTILWRWEGDQFGTSTPQIEKIKLPLRHAGQYADSETGLFYNWHRYYDPSSGRYLRSDPIGLKGGLNTFGYVGGNPLSFFDMYGLMGGDVDIDDSDIKSIPDLIGNYNMYGDFSHIYAYTEGGVLKIKITCDDGRVFNFTQNIIASNIDVVDLMIEIMDKKEAAKKHWKSMVPVYCKDCES